MSSITKVLFQTNKIRPSQSIIDMILKQLPPGWKYDFYTDQDVIEFLMKHPLDEFPDIIQKWFSFKRGAHRADLFRYYYLYVKGGMFLDSDAMIYSPLEPVIDGCDLMSVTSCTIRNSIFQGILAVTPKNKIIYNALLQAYDTTNDVLANDYHCFCRQMYKIIHSDISKGINIKLLQEIKHNDTEDSVINHKGEVLFKHYWKFKMISVSKSYVEEFTSIYENNYWLSGSGAGSSKQNTMTYNKCMIDFFKRNSIKTVTDIGCGDWQSSHLIYDAVPSVDYLGLDWVESVVEANKKAHPTHSFEYMDIIPNLSSIRDSDVYIIKDMFQHLRLDDIRAILEALTKKNYKYIIISNSSNQKRDNQELETHIAIGRGLHSKFSPLSDYGAVAFFDYFADDNKHVCIIQKDFTMLNHYNKDEANEFPYSVLTTYDIHMPKVRIGPNCDGGYVVTDGIQYDSFLSCGIADDLRFEDAFLDKHKVDCMVFDGTINKLPYHRNMVHWEKKNIGSMNSPFTTNLKEYMKGQNIFLKMDIEGSEFNWIDSMTKEDLSRFAQIVIEIHWPFDTYRSNMLAKLNETHYLIHLHGNNYCDKDIPAGMPSGRSMDGMIEIGDKIRLPEVLEGTYVRKDITTEVTKKEIQFPTSLDYPNNKNAKDICFSIPI